MLQPQVGGGAISSRGVSEPPPQAKESSGFPRPGDAPEAFVASLGDDSEDEGFEPRGYSYA
eukprot:979636-Alexandrium_andersonii.AAC.1